MATKVKFLNFCRNHQHCQGFIHVQQQYLIFRRYNHLRFLLVSRLVGLLIPIFNTFSYLVFVTALVMCIFYESNSKATISHANPHQVRPKNPPIRPIYFLSRHLFTVRISNNFYLSILHVKKNDDHGYEIAHNDH